MSDVPVYDPAELVRDLAERIGVNQLCTIAEDLREDEDPSVRKLKNEIEDLKSRIQLADRNQSYLKGLTDGLKFALRCNGVSGGEVN